MRSTDLGDVSLEPTLLGTLSHAQKERLTDVLDRYLSSLDGTVPLDRATLLAENPDLAEPLAAYLDRLDELHDAAAGFAGGEEASPAEAAAPSDGEKQIGDFRLVREIGRGGMGVVYEAWQVSLGRRVALKVLPFAAVLDSKQIARFRNEAQAAAQLHHANIVPVFAVGVERGVHFYAMQFIDGQPLDQAIEELRGATGDQSPSAKKDTGSSPSLASTVILGAQSADTYRSDRASHGSLLKHDFAKRGSFYRTAVRLGIEAAEALHAAHEFGVVHRDVKPSNLLLDGDGKLWVTDFGLARIQSSASLTKTGDLVGTLRYMSPEQAAGRAALVDQRTDVYSLGATLYELLTLRHAFEGDDGPTLLKRIDQEEPRPLRQLAPRVPADLETVVHKAMSKSPTERYATAKDFADDLRRVLDGQPTLAKPPTVVDRLSKWARRHHRVVLAAVAVGLCAIASLAIGTALILNEKAEAERNLETAELNFARADRNYRDALDAVDDLGQNMVERLANEPGSSHFRRELLGATIGYYRKFIERAADDSRQDDPRLRVDMALAYGKIGKLTEGIDGAAQSLSSHRDACRLLQEVAVADASRVEYRQHWGEALNGLALACYRAGELAEARQAIDASIAIREQLVEIDPNNAKYRGDLALSFTNLGLLLLRDGKDTSAAKKLFDDAMTIQRQLIDGDPNDAENLANLAATQNNLVAVYGGSDPSSALDACRRAVEFMSRARDARPRDVDYQSRLATMLSNLGALEANSSNFDAATAAYQRAIDLQRRLHDAAKENKTFRRDLAVSYNNLGLLQTRLRRPDEAERSFLEALDLYKPLTSLYPHDHSLASSVGGVYNNLGFLLAALGRDREAATEYELAIRHQRRAVEEAGQVVQYREFLSKHYYNYAQVLRKLNRPQDAMKAALDRRELWDDDAKRLISVAEELALVWKMLSARPDAAAAEECAGHVLSTLKQAGGDANVATVLEENAAFAELIKRPEFAALLRSAR